MFSTVLVVMLSACGNGKSSDTLTLLPKADTKSGKFGYVNLRGKEIIPFKYDHAEDFSDGFANVTLNNKKIFINQEGQEFESIGDMSDDLRTVMTNKKYGFADITGQVVIPVQYNAAGKFSDGLAPVLMTTNNPPLASITSYGFIDKTGTVVIPFQYDAANYFSEGLAAVAQKGKGFGFIDKTGQVVIPLKYDEVFPFSDGLAKVWLKKWGYIDKTGNVVVPLKYDAIRDFSEGLALVMLNRKCGYVDMNGKEVIPLKFGGGRDFSEGLAMVTLSGMKENVPAQYSRLISEGIILPGIDTFGYIDKTGKEIIHMKYDDAKPFSGGFAAVKLNNKWGFIDSTGNVVIQFEYDDANSFSEGKAKVKSNQKEFYIDTKGNEVQE